jgi:membrane-associated phospholipid phosphatase
MGLVRPSRLLGAALSLAAAQPVAAQAHPIQWWEVAAAAATVGAVSVFDRGIDTWMQDHRTSGSDRVAAFFRTGGQPAFFLSVGGGITAAGLISDRPALRRSGERVLASILLAGVTTAALKKSAGRVRPSDVRDQYVFKPFSPNDAFPSGHATIAFALAGSLSDEISRPWASAVLYSAAAGTAWSRLNDHRHWTSDVVAGAAVGITSAKLIGGRWRIFRLRPPTFLVDPRGNRIEWSIPF